MIRALRIAVADEYEAIQIYSHIRDATDDPGIRAIIREIIGEEKKHAGQFRDIISEIDPEEAKAFDKAGKENRDIREKTAQ